jgi:hypothetical protein
MADAKAPERRRCTIEQPEQEGIFGGVGVQEELFMVPSEAGDVVALLLQGEQEVHDGFAFGTAVDVIAQKVELILRSDTELLPQQRFQGGDAAVDVADDEASHRKPWSASAGKKDAFRAVDHRRVRGSIAIAAGAFS